MTPEAKPNTESIVQPKVAFGLTADEIAQRANDGWNFGPPNPLYEREWVCSLDHGRASLVISAPGGKIGQREAQDVIDWLEIVMDSLKRMAAPH